MKLLRVLFLAVALCFQLIFWLGFFDCLPFKISVSVLQKSDYLSDKLRSYGLVKEGFLELKMLLLSEKTSEKEYPWIFLKELSEKEDGLSITVFDRRGNSVFPGGGEEAISPFFLDTPVATEPKGTISVKKDVIEALLPLYYKKECLICHSGESGSNLAGVMRIREKFDPDVFFVSGRKILFLVLAFLDFGLILFLLIYVPHKSIKELFDNKR